VAAFLASSFCFDLRFVFGNPRPGGSVRQGRVAEDVFLNAGLGTDGNFHGMTFNGGSVGYGNVFKITQGATLTVLQFSP
jgi:uncharacterized repeat protein (TIGR03803 family)